MHEYETTHPWLTFSVNLSRTPPKIWTILGECSALCQALDSLPLPEEDYRSIVRSLTVRWLRSSFSSGLQALSDNELNAVIDNASDLPPSRRYLAVEAGNLVGGIARIRAQSGTGIGNRPRPSLIREYNEMALDRLVLPEHVKPGDYRTETTAPVVGTHAPAPAGDCPLLVENLCDWLGSPSFVPQEGMDIIYGLITTVLAHLYLRWIQPFWAGNTRTSRLVEYHILASSGVPDPAALLLGIHYASTPSEYERQLETTGGPEGKILPFLNNSIEGFRDGLVELLDKAQACQKSALWKHRVNEMFMDRSSPADIRRRRLAMEMCSIDMPVPVPKLLDTIPSAAALYAAKTYKTLTRDINDLVSMRLLKKDSGGVRINGDGC